MFETHNTAASEEPKLSTHFAFGSDCAIVASLKAAVIVGGLSTLCLFKSTLSLDSVIGLFLLLGIVKKNGILVVDFASQRIDEGWDLRSAIYEASMLRFRPIMMTTFANLMGALPLAIGFGSGALSRRHLVLSLSVA